MGSQRLANRDCQPAFAVEQAGRGLPENGSG